MSQISTQPEPRSIWNEILLIVFVVLGILGAGNLISVFGPFIANATGYVLPYFLIALVFGAVYKIGAGIVLAKFLTELNPWHVLLILFVSFVVLMLLITPWNQLAVLADDTGTSQLALILQAATAPILTCIFLAIGIKLGK